MKTTKTIINKSRLMKSAWTLFKNNHSQIFSVCLKTAWQIEKNIVKEYDINLLYAKYNKQLYYYILQMTKRPEIAEELTNDTFIKANNNLYNYNPEMSKINTWLHTIAKNIVIDYFRIDKSNKLVHVSDYMDEKGNEIFTIADTCKTDNIINTELSEKIMESINKLKPVYKNVISLYLIDQLKMQEISDKLLIPLNTVKVTILRAKAELQNSLQNEYINL